MLARPNVKRIVDVRTLALASILQAQVSNRGLMIVDTPLIDYDKGVIEINSLKDMTEIYGFNIKSPVYKQASAYFKGITGFVNIPSSLLLAKDIRNYSVGAALYGNKGIDIYDVTQVGAGSINIMIDTSTIPVAISGANITAGLVAIAGVIQTAVKAFVAPAVESEKKLKANPLYPNATCVFDTGLNRFVITTGESGTAATIGYATNVGLSTLADALGLTANAGARLQEGRTGANIYQQMDYILKREINFAMFGFITPIPFVAGGTDEQNAQLLDMLNWFKDPVNSAFVNQYQFFYSVSSVDVFDPVSTTNIAAWLIAKGFAQKREVVLDDGSIFKYTVYNTNLTLSWDRDNTNRMMGGMMSYGASWIVTNVNTYPSWNNALNGLVTNDITDIEYQMLTEQGFNVYTSFAPALVDTTKNEMGNCGIVGTGMSFSDVMYLSQFYVIRTLNGSLQIALLNAMNSAPNIPMNGASSLPSIPLTTAYFDAVLNPVLVNFVNGVYLTSKNFNLDLESDRQQLREIKLILAPSTTDDEIITDMANPCYILQYGTITNSNKISSKIFATLVYCVGSQVRAIALNATATN